VGDDYLLWDYDGRFAAWAYDGDRPARGEHRARRAEAIARPARPGGGMPRRRRLLLVAAALAAAVVVPSATTPAGGSIGCTHGISAAGPVTFSGGRLTDAGPAPSRQPCLP
jgi:hypothetical protein